MLRVEKGIRDGEEFKGKDIEFAHYIFCADTTDLLLRSPLPDLRKEVKDVIEVRLTSRRVDDCLKRDAEE
mgnify:CR=1 FL=1